jgi:hypothetical protein
MKTTQMKTTILLFICLFSSVMIFATSPTTISVSSTAGGLSAAITSAGGSLSTLTNLTVSGTMDARDFLAIRDNMPALTVLNVSDVTIISYTGTGGTNSVNATANISYPANEFPEWSFCSPLTGSAKTGLTTITLPSSIKTVGDCAFIWCSGITGIVIPNSVTSIRSNAFSYCSGLKSLILSSSLTSIGSYAFRGLSSLTTFTIPATVTSIGQEAFYSNSTIAAINIPASVTSIDLACFAACSALITVDPANPNYSTENGSLYNKNKTQLLQVAYPTVGNYVIIPTVTAIMGSAFSWCNQLQSLTIPASVTSIANYTFSYANRLSRINVYSATPINLSGTPNAFNTVPVTTCELHVPKGCKAAYQAASQWSAFTHIIEDLTPTIYSTAGGLSAAITAAGFSLSTLTDIIITGTIDARDFVTIREYIPLLKKLDMSGATIAAYSGAQGTDWASQNPTYPANEIPAYASLKNGYVTAYFLTSLVLPSNTTSIGRYALAACVYLPNGSLQIPSTVTHFGYASLRLNNGLSTILTLPLTQLTIEDWAFSEDGYINTLKIPSSIVSMGINAFVNCSGLRTIYSESLTPPTIGIGCFAGVTSVLDVFVQTVEAVTAYKANASWIGFFPGDIIKKDTGTGVLRPADSNINIYVADKNIVVDGINGGEKVSVYSINGTLLNTFQAAGGSLTIKLQNSGVYIVKTAHKTVKVVL